MIFAARRRASASGARRISIEEILYSKLDSSTYKSSGGGSQWVLVMELGLDIGEREMEIGIEMRGGNARRL